MCDGAVVLTSGCMTNPLGRLVGLSPVLPGRSPFPNGFEDGDIIVGSHVPAIQNIRHVLRNALEEEFASWWEFELNLSHFVQHMHTALRDSHFK